MACCDACGHERGGGDTPNLSAIHTLFPRCLAVNFQDIQDLVRLHAASTDNLNLTAVAERQLHVKPLLLDHLQQLRDSVAILPDVIRQVDDAGQIHDDIIQLQDELEVGYAS